MLQELEKGMAVLMSTYAVQEEPHEEEAAFLKASKAAAKGATHRQALAHGTRCCLQPAPAAWSLSWSLAGPGSLDSV